MISRPPSRLLRGRRRNPAAAPAAYRPPPGARKNPLLKVRLLDKVGFKGKIKIRFETAPPVTGNAGSRRSAANSQRTQCHIGGRDRRANAQYVASASVGVDAWSKGTTQRIIRSGRIQAPRAALVPGTELRLKGRRRPTAPLRPVCAHQRRTTPVDSLQDLSSRWPSGGAPARRLGWIRAGGGGGGVASQATSRRAAVVAARQAAAATVLSSTISASGSGRAHVKRARSQQAARRARDELLERLTLRRRDRGDVDERLRIEGCPSRRSSSRSRRKGGRRGRSVPRSGPAGSSSRRSRCRARAGGWRPRSRDSRACAGG